MAQMCEISSQTYFVSDILTKYCRHSFFRVGTVIATALKKVSLAYLSTAVANGR